jgi:two-component system, sensor histidine kinase and response regulator
MTPDSSARIELPATDPAALDRLKRFGGDKLLREMIALFLVAAPERLESARRAGAAADPGGVEQALHSLKSSSAQLGAMRMQRLSEQGEHRARGGSVDGLGTLLAELDDEHARVRQWLTRTRDGEAA